MPAVIMRHLADTISRVPEGHTSDSDGTITADRRPGRAETVPVITPSLEAVS